MRRSVFALFGLCLALPIQADPLYGSWSIEALALCRNVEEIGASGSTLLEESGLEPAIEFAGAWPAGSGSMIGRLLLSRYTLDYEGRSQAGRPVDSETDYRRLRLGVGYAYPLAETWRIRLELESEWLDRDIAGVENIAGLNEEMRSTRLLAGAEKSVTIANRTVTLDLAALWGVSGTQEVSSPGVIDEVKLPEGRSWGVRGAVQIPLNPQSTSGWSWVLTPRLEYLHSDRSENRLWTQDGVVQGLLAQPETRRWAVGVGLMAIW